MVTAELVLMNNAQAKVYEFQIADMAGLILVKKIIKNSDAVIRYNVQQLKAGYYFVKVNTSNGFVVLPWIKQ